MQVGIEYNIVDLNIEFLNNINLTKIKMVITYLQK